MRSFFYTGSDDDEKDPMKPTYSVTPYTYPATFIRALSGDRFIARIHVGFGWSIEQIVKIENVIAPPLVDSEGLEGFDDAAAAEAAKKAAAAKDFVQRKLSESKIYVITRKPTEYGRCDALVRVINPWSYGRVVDFGEMLIEEKFCTPSAQIIAESAADEPEVR